MVDLTQVKNLSWNGLTPVHRGQVWRMLLRYVPYNKKNQQSVLGRKRTEYQRFIEMHKDDPEDEALKKIHKVIYFDVLRT